LNPATRTSREVAEREPVCVGAAIDDRAPTAMSAKHEVRGERGTGAPTGDLPTVRVVSRERAYHDVVCVAARSPNSEHRTERSVRFRRVDMREEDQGPSRYVGQRAEPMRLLVGAPMRGADSPCSGRTETRHSA
jgi:hypothetical protein